MSAITNKNYKTTFILDLRESEDDPAKVLAELTELLGSLNATVSEGKELGMREFARAADRRFAQGNYLEIRFSSPSAVPSQLKEKLKLDKRINRIFIESV
jgi:ribosomal protein S6